MIDRKVELEAVTAAAEFYKDFMVRAENIDDIDEGVSILEEAVHTFENKSAHFRKDSETYRVLDTTLNPSEKNTDARYTVYFAVSGSYTHMDVCRYLEDLTMAKYKLLGGKMNYTPNFIDSVKNFIATGKFDFIEKEQGGVVR